MILTLVVTDASPLISLATADALDLLRGASNPRIEFLTTRGFLDALEARGRIQSATAILDKAQKQGRTVGRHGMPVNPDAVSALQARLDEVYGPRA